MGQLDERPSCQPFRSTTGGLVAVEGTVANAFTVTVIVAASSRAISLIADIVTSYSPAGTVSDAANII
jgi:hypothetical protein